MKRREALACLAGAWTAQPRRPNFLLILADDLGSGDLTSYGCPDIRTPHIDSIGRRGMRFTQFYASAPVCTPTRTALLTGRYPQRPGGLETAIGLGDVGRYDDAIWLAEQGELGLPPSESVLAAGLKKAGYDTGCFGKWHLGYREKFGPNRHGFDEFFGVLGGATDYFRHIEPDGRHVLYHNDRPVNRRGYLTDLFAEDAMRWLRGRRGRPFFLYLAFNAPHNPFQGPEDAEKKITAANWNTGDRPTFVRMVERMDDRVGAVLEALERSGAVENTVVIFTSDNGGERHGRNAPLRGGKGSLWEGGIRAPCLVCWPGVVREGTTTPQVGLTMDLTATLLAAAGAGSKARLDGIDLGPVLAGRQTPFARTVFWRHRRGDAVRKAARDGDLKYVWDSGQEALHNLGEDEREQRNLLAAAPDAAARLRAKLAAWEREVQSLRAMKRTMG
jgi:N-acetylgalactosamine-6-sulfatase